MPLMNPSIASFLPELRMRSLLGNDAAPAPTAAAPIVQPQQSMDLAPQPNRMSSLFPVNANQGGTPMNGDLIPLQRERLSPLFDVNNPSAAQIPTPIDTSVDEPMQSEQQQRQPTLQDYGYQEQHAGIDKMNQMLLDYPKPKEHSMLRKIFGGIVQGAGGGPAAYEQIVHGGDWRALNDWKAQFEPVERLATQERGANLQSRTAAESLMRNQTAQDKIQADERYRTEANRIAAAKVAIAKYVAENPKAEYKVTRDGDIVALKDGKAEFILGPDGMRVKSIELTPDEAQRYKLELLDDAQEAALKLEGVRSAAALGRVQTQQAGANYRQSAGDAAAMEREKLRAETRIKTAKGVQPANLQYIQQQAQDTIALIDNEIIQAGGKAGEFRLRPEVKDAVGIARLIPTRKLYATQQRKGDAAINRLKAKMVIDLIAEMKAQSKTGATGFGALNMKELGVLEQAASKLDPALDQATFLTELLRIRERLQKILQPADGLNPTKTTKTPVTADDYLKEAGI